ncbi:MAG: amidohydrolase family protein [Planctomycetales bacterium]|nr:amidohydrolase family protein [Planctomycetales bacterium]
MTHSQFSVPQNQLNSVSNSDQQKPDSPFEIWDLHGHLAGQKGQTPQERAVRLLHFADRMNITRLCLYMGMSFSYAPTPEEMRQQNDEVLQALQVNQDRLLGFVYLNPQFELESLDELERCVADGPMVGVKLWVAVRAIAPSLDRIVDRATELGAIVFQHSWLKINGNLPGESTPMDVADLARRHPESNIICGHAGGDWEQGICAIKDSENVFIDLGGGDPTAGFTEMAVRELGSDRVIYGSDVPGRSFGTQLAKVLGAEIPEFDKKRILAGNLRSLLSGILGRKGIAL